MGFKYVLIPASTNDAMQELEFEDDIVDLQKDTFREHVERYFAMSGQVADRSVLMEQLKARTGVDLKEPSAMPGEALDRLLASTSVEIFPVLLPTKETDFTAISMYCDDKGVAKCLEENTRASGLVQASGYPGQTFRGDIFVGRVFDDNEEEWRRTDLTLKDCSSDSDWSQMTRKQRSHRSSGDMASMAAKVGASNPARITPAMLEEKATGETETYRWRQTDEEVEITFKSDSLQKGDRKLVKVTFGRQKLKVVVRGESLIDAALHGPTQADESTWTLHDGELQVNLVKAGEDSWPQLLKP